MKTNKWLDTWCTHWVRMKRGWELGISGLILAMGALLFVALLPELPGLIWGALNGDSDAARTLFVCAAGIAVCLLQWRWRTAFYPQLRRDATRHKPPNSQR
jgi:membrane protease YdiL (CAAX protease family)